MVRLPDSGDEGESNLAKDIANINKLGTYETRHMDIIRFFILVSAYDGLVYCWLYIDQLLIALHIAENRRILARSSSLSVDAKNVHVCYGTTIRSLFKLHRLSFFRLSYYTVL